MNVHFNSEKDSFSELPNAAEYIDALQKMYKVVAASTPPPQKNEEHGFFLFRRGTKYVLSNRKMFWTV